MKYLTQTSSELMVSPIAHRLCDFAAGHCSVSVLLKTPFASREKLPEDSVPVIGFTTNLVVAGDEDEGKGERGEANGDDGADAPLPPKEEPDACAS